MRQLKREVTESYESRLKKISEIRLNLEKMRRLVNDLIEEAENSELSSSGEQNTLAGLYSGLSKCLDYISDYSR